MLRRRRPAGTSSPAHSYSESDRFLPRIRPTAPRGREPHYAVAEGYEEDTLPRELSRRLLPARRSGSMRGAFRSALLHLAAAGSILFGAGSYVLFGPIAEGDMEKDDRPVGRILGRREALRLLSAGGAAVFAAGAVSLGAPASTPRDAVPTPSCIVRPELTEGPYFADVELDRSDIRDEPSTGEVRPGVPLALTFTVARISAGACVPLPGARVDVWQCDAQGRYSAFQDRRAGFDTRDQKFLRGYQETDSDGVARFTTIYPGWYPGRAVHIHFKIRRPADEGRTYEFTSQLFFDEALSGDVFARRPYLAKGDRYVRNADDFIYRRGGDQLLLDVTPQGEGFEAAFTLGLDLSDAASGRTD